MKNVFKYLRPYVWRMALGLSIKLFGSVMDLFLPMILAHMIDEVAPTGNAGMIYAWGVVMIICAIIAVVGNVTANRMASGVARDCTRRLRHDLFTKILYLSCTQSDHLTVPSMVSRLTSDTYNVHSFISMMQRMGVRAPLLLIGGLTLTFILDPVLALVQVAMLPLICLIVYFVSKNGIPLFNRMQKSVDELVRIVRENASGIRVIKALSKTEYERNRFDKVNSEVAVREQKANLIMSISNPTINFLLNAGLVLVIIVGAFRVDAGLAKPGKITAFLTYFTIILNAMLSVTRIFVMYSRASASADRINEVLNLPSDMPLSPADHRDTEYHIEVEDLCFSYNKISNDIEHVSFRLKRGQTLGVLGSTGSGKTTLVALLLRFYDADFGSIRIDGDDIRSIPSEKLHAMFGVAFQNDVLLADSLRENIAFGREMGDDTVLRAAETAQAMEFIAGFEDSFEHPLTIRGANLSGGQRQRVLVSRALAGNPKILILDDSSSALDYKTDARLRSAIAKCGGLTSIIVAQRISSVRNADVILVLDEGKVVGCGKHEELMKRCDLYRETAQFQMGGDENEN